MSRRQALRAAGAAGVAAWVAPAVITTSAAAAASAAGCALCGVELVENGSAELYQPALLTNAQYDPNAGVGTAPGAVPELWTTTNGFRVVTYGSIDYPATAPAGAGTVMFCGSLDAGSASPGTATQTVPVDACATEIDAGTVGYELSARLGGGSAEADTMELTVELLSAALVVLATDSLGPVAASSGFGSYVTTGSVPALTRFARLTLVATKLGAAHDRNTAAADLVSFTLC